MMSLSLNKKNELYKKYLFHWFKKNKRIFPWRQIKNPYKILITEILLQRTRVNKVNEIYNLFFEKYPDLLSLSNTNEEDISKTIAPLGLKKRGPYLIDLSKILREKYDSNIPKNIDELLNLKGVGFYTANAVMCFAYGKSRAVVDWNVARVIQRIWDIDISSSPHTNKKVMAFAQKLVPEKNPEEYNWAFLDFAALVCKPRKPDCCNCPMKYFCIYYKKKVYHSE